ncbi:retrovirus-related pol polyprotein from transposon TNT 1-94, partial [Tanacetum coccineum]
QPVESSLGFSVLAAQTSLQKILTPSLGHPDAVTRNCDAVSTNCMPLCDQFRVELQSCPVSSQIESKSRVEHIVPGDTDNDLTSPDDHTNLPHLEHEQDRSIAYDRPRRIVKAPNRFEVITSNESDMWITAMGEAIESLHKSNTWELVKLPKRRKVVGWKWVFKMKTGLPAFHIIKFKARLAAKGYSQKEGIDYNEIFSSVVHHTSIRVLLSLVAHRNLKLEKLDVKTVFLHGDLEEEIYMSQPEGLVVQGKEDYFDVCYALHEAGYSSRNECCATIYGSSWKRALECDETHFSLFERDIRFGLIYDSECEYLVARYSNSDYAADLDDRRSLTGYVFTIGNSVVSWKATLQPSVTLCTTESEYIALTKAAKEGIWLKGLIEDLGFPQD